MSDKFFQPFAVIGLFAVILLSSCSHTPKGIIPEKKMRDVLIDMEMAEIIINENPDVYMSLDKKKALFRSVFEKHHLTEAEYDSSLMWYGRNIDIYMQVYDRAIEEVDERIKDMGDMQVEAFDAPYADSINVWVDKKYYVFFPKAVSNMVVFDLKPVEPYSADSRFVWEMQFWGLSSDKKQYIELNLRVDQMDTTVMAKAEINTDGLHRLTLHGIPDKPVERIYGYIRMKSSIVPYRKIYIDGLRLTKYRTES